MNARLGWFTAVSLFTAAAALIAAGHPLVAAVLLMGVTYLAGRSDRRRDRDAVVALLAAECARLAAVVAGLQDEQTNYWNNADAGRFADDARLLPDRRDWADVNRKPEVERTAAPDRIITLP